MRKTKDPISDKAQAHLTVAITALAFGVPMVDVFARQRLSSSEIFLRQMSMYLLNTVFDFNLSRVARVFARDRTTVRHACQLIEDQRDSAAFDETLTLLEGYLQQSRALEPEQ
jgi:chromosomal replication initiation ATPase DnaA